MFSSISLFSLVAVETFRALDHREQEETRYSYKRMQRIAIIRLIFTKVQQCTD